MPLKNEIIIFKKLNMNFLKFSSIFIIDISIFIVILCQNNNTNNNPNQISTNFYELNILPSGSRLKLEKNTICFYDYIFSKSINENKNIICLENYQFIYIFNNKDTFLYKFDLGILKTDGSGNHLSLIPYSFCNNIYFIIYYIDNNNNLNLTQYQINTIDNSSKIINNTIFEKHLISSFQYPLNCTVSLNSNLYLICFFMENNWIYSFTFDI